MKSISLIGYTSDKGVIKYYTKIQHLNDKELNYYVPCQITPYSLLLQDDDDENVRHLVDGFFHVTSNSPNAIVLCDFYLEFLWEHIPFPSPVIISQFESLLKIVIQWNILRVPAMRGITITFILLKSHQKKAENKREMTIFLLLGSR